ncbi:hypothetical protein BJY24_004356 [Nocardia transvalensis]|uniref:Uncharacterized protein n=1 Tax=Nocardia transvalensis TaxID=37333 RepID=A0A7W9PFY5_9NOCA|nr:hypothetical protein [Nocardia transvalensis]
MLDWQVGLVIAIGIPLVVIAGCAFWPQRPPKGRSVRAIRERIDREQG